MKLNNILWWQPVCLYITLLHNFLDKISSSNTLGKEMPSFKRISQHYNSMVFSSHECLIGAKNNLTQKFKIQATILIEFEVKGTGYDEDLMELLQASEIEAFLTMAEISHTKEFDKAEVILVKATKQATV